MPGLEEVSFEIDPRSVVGALAQMNTAVEGFEKGSTGANQRLQDSFERVSNLMLRMNDKAQDSNLRLVRSNEMRAASYGKEITEVQRLIAQRDEYNKRLAGSEEAIRRNTAAFEQMISKAEASESGGKFKEFGENISKFIESPMRSAGNAATSLWEKMGPAGAVFAGVTVAGLGVGAALYEMAKAGGEAGEGIVNLSAQTGIATGKLELLMAAGKIAGVDMNSMARAGTQMATTLDEGGAKAQFMTAALGRLGLSVTDMGGDVGKIIPAAIEKLSQMQDITLRNATAGELFGARLAKSIEPVLGDYEETTGLLKSMGLGMDDTSRKADDWAKMLHTVGVAADFAKEKLAGMLGEQLKVDIKFESEGGEGLLGKLYRGYNAADARSTSFVNAAMGVTYGPQQGWNVSAPHGAPGAPNLDTSFLSAKAAIDARNATPLSSLETQLKTAKENMVEYGSLGHADINKYSEAAKAAASLTSQIDALKESMKGASDKAATITGRMANVPLTRRGAVNPFSSGNLLGNVDTQFNMLPVGASGNGPGIGDFLTAGQAQQNDYYQSQLAAIRGREQSALGSAKLSGVGGAPNRADALDQEYQIKVQYSNELYAAERQHALDNGELVGKMDTEHENSLNELRQSNQLALSDLYFNSMKEAQDKLNEAQKAVAEDQQRIAEQQHKEIAGVASGLFDAAITNKKGSFQEYLVKATDKQISKEFGSMVGDIFVPGGNKKSDEQAKLEVDRAHLLALQQNTAALYAHVQVTAATMGASVPVPSSVGGIAVPNVSIPSVNIPSGGGYAGGGWSGGGGGYSSGGWGTNIFNPSFGGDSFGAPGGTSGFAGPVFQTGTTASMPGRNLFAGLFGGGGGSGSGGGAQRNPFAGIFGGGGGGTGPAGLLGALKGGWAGLGSAIGYHGAQGWTAGVGNSPGTIASSVASSPLAGISGMMLGEAGLFGSRRGTAAGIIESGAGGALIGEQYGGPVGAAVGAAAGILAGGIEMAIGDVSPEQKAKQLCKQIYGLNIDNQMAQQIAQIAQSKYGGNVTVAVHSPEVRQMLGLYAAGTGQKMPLSATTPQAGSLAEQGGKLYQQATYQYGNAYSYSGNVPVLGGVSSTVNPGASQPMSLSLNVGGQDLNSFMAGNVITPDVIQDQVASAWAAGNGRVTSSASMQGQPNLIT
jgi:hypothetical protein